MAIFTGRLERAIALALRAHANQVRKGDGELPYVVHPVTVALILSRFTADEDVIIAGLLLDTLEEDTAVTADQLESEFGASLLIVRKLDPLERDVASLKKIADGVGLRRATLSIKTDSWRCFHRR